MFASLDKVEQLEYSFPDSSTIEIKLNSDDDIQQVISLCMKVGSVLDIKFKSSDINHIFVSYFSKNIV